MGDLFTYGPGIPRYLALWLPLTPLLLVGLRRAGVRWTTVGVVLASTLPTFGLHVPSTPGWPHGARYAVFVAAEVVVLWWLVRVTAGGGTPTEEGAPPQPGWPAEAGRDRDLPWAAAGALVVLTLLLRVPLAWVDPGIGDFARASGTAAADLLAGTNPYTVPNPHTTFGTYQYPAGTLLAHVPFVAALPTTVLGEGWLPARATVWAGEVAAVVLLVWAGTRLASPRAGTVAGGAYALHPTVVREAGIVVANDLLLAVAVTAAAYALVRRRHLAAAALVGVAIAVKPAAAVLLPVLVVAAGVRWLLAAGAVPALLQVPFLLWPRPGLHGLRAIVEPAARDDPYGALQASVWWPWYAVTGGQPWAVTAAAAVGLAAALGAAVWVGRRLREDRSPVTVACGLAVPLAAAFLLASVQRTNYEDWALTPMLLAVGLLADRSRRPPPGRSTPRRPR